MTPKGHPSFRHLAWLAPLEGSAYDGAALAGPGPRGRPSPSPRGGRSMSVATRLLRQQVTGLAAVLLLACSAPAIESASSRGGAGGTGGARGGVGGSAGAAGTAPVGPGPGAPIPDAGG